MCLCISVCSTFVCPTEIIAFSDRIKDFEALNTAVVGVSVDSHFRFVVQYEFFSTSKYFNKHFHLFLTSVIWHGLIHQER